MWDGGHVSPSLASAEMSPGLAVILQGPGDAHSGLEAEIQMCTRDLL